MTHLSCFSSSHQVCVSLKIDRPRSLPKTQLFCQQVNVKEKKNQFSFLGCSKKISIPIFGRNATSRRRKSSAVYASWLPNSEIANTAFTLGTAAVIPFYTFMIVAPKTQITKKLVGSSIPYIVLGILYGYLLYLSWTPDTFRLMFSSEYWLPEFPGIAKLFSSEMTLASAWIHLLAVDLFAARQVYYEGLRDDIETRHSVSLCLLFCPIGILAHSITKAITKTRV